MKSSCCWLSAVVWLIGLLGRSASLVAARLAVSRLPLLDLTHGVVWRHRVHLRCPCGAGVCRDPGATTALIHAATAAWRGVKRP